MSEPCDVIVIGGGVIGAACAEYLTRAGRRVTILEKDRFGMACSSGNCGLLCPSHVLPLAEPGALSKTLGLMLKRHSPFTVRPRFDPGLWAWFLRFARRCNRTDMLTAAESIHALLGSSMREYDILLSGELSAEFASRGLLFVYRDRDAFEKFAATDTLLRERFSVAAERLDAARLTEFEPSLKPDVAGAWWYADDAHVRPESLMCSWRRSLESRGVSIHENCPVEGFVTRGGRAVAVRTSQGEMMATTFVLATGALTPRFATTLGCRLPIQPGKGYSITTPRPGICPTVPMIFMEEKVAVTPFESGYRIGSTMEFAGYDASIPPARLDLLRRAAAVYLREASGGPSEEHWFGWRPMTYDGLPIIDHSPRWLNVWITAGHNMLGMSMAPATGRLLSELVTGAEPHLDPAPYRVTRF